MIQTKFSVKSIEGKFPKIEEDSALYLVFQEVSRVSLDGSYLSKIIQERTIDGQTLTTFIFLRNN
jgi:hypothetical protein